MTATARRPLEGRTALVTGALGGLGSAIARELARAGASVALNHVGQPEEAAAAATELAEGEGVRAVAVEADVTRWDLVQAMVALVERELGGIDVLVNNAGAMEPARFADMSLDHWRAALDVDLTSVFICSRLVVEGMLARGHGVIVNMSSQLAFKGAHHYVSYCAAKAGLIGLTRAMARELGPAIRVNAIAPGPVDTPMIAPYDTRSWREERTRELVIQRLATPSEIAPAVAFLASPAAGLMHGQTLHVNGGGVMA